MGFVNLSLCPLPHSSRSQAFREAVPKLEKLAAAVKLGAGNTSSLRELSATWTSVSKAHDIHSRHEEQVIFPVLEGYFPGQVRKFPEENIPLSARCSGDTEKDKSLTQSTRANQIFPPTPPRS